MVVKSVKWRWEGGGFQSEKENDGEHRFKPCEAEADCLGFMKESHLVGQVTHEADCKDLDSFSVSSHLLSCRLSPLCC